MMEEFKTEVSLDLSSSDLEKYLKKLGHDYEIDSINTEQVSIKWTLELEMRIWGIKSAIAFVPIQSIAVSLEVFRAGSEESETVEVELQLEGIEIESSEEVPTCPGELELYDGRWTLKFK